MYATDTWDIGAVSINVGVRFDRYRAGFPDQDRPDNRFAPGVHVQGIDNVMTWNVVAPRAGISWDMTGRSRNVLKASAGRYYHNPSRTVSEAINPNNTPQWRRYNWLDVNGDLIWQPGEEGTLLETRGGIAQQSICAASAVSRTARAIPPQCLWTLTTSSTPTPRRRETPLPEARFCVP